LEECDVLLDGEKFVRIKGTFDYLMDLPIKSLTLKNAQKHENDLEELRSRIAELEGKTPSSLWLEDLGKLVV
jgi:glyoxylate utilization-related uncharacterized protein